MTEYAELEKKRDAARAAFYDFIDKCWWGTAEEKQANLGDPEKYKQLRDSYEEAQSALLKWRPR